MKRQAEDDIRHELLLAQSPETKIKLENKLRTILWIKDKIKILNGDRYKTIPGARINCTLLSEKCALVLGGYDEPAVVPAVEEEYLRNFILNNEKIVYHESFRKQHATLFPLAEFNTQIDLTLSNPKETIDFITLKKKDLSLKFITSSVTQIKKDIEKLQSGIDGKLCGYLFYYHEGQTESGHAANFLKDEFNNIFFVDAQNNTILEEPPSANFREEVFFFPLPPKNGYPKPNNNSLAIKTEPVTKPQQQLDNILQRHELTLDSAKTNLTTKFLTSDQIIEIGRRKSDKEALAEFLEKEIYPSMKEISLSEIKDEHEFTLLHYAVFEHDLAKIKYLTNLDVPKEKRIPCNIMHKSGNSLNHYACLNAQEYQGNQKCIDVLCYFADKERGNERLPFNIQHPDGGTPLHSAAFASAFDVMEFLTSSVCGNERMNYSDSTKRMDGLNTVLSILKYKKANHTSVSSDELKALEKAVNILSNQSLLTKPDLDLLSNLYNQCASKEKFETFEKKISANFNSANSTFNILKNAKGNLKRKAKYSQLPFFSKNVANSQSFIQSIDEESVQEKSKRQKNINPPVKTNPTSNKV